MNTPDTEWEERFNEVYPSVTVGYDGSEMDARTRAKVWQFIEDEITTLNARHHTTLSSRDTYWKERVENTRTALLFIGEKVLKEMSEIYAVDIKYADKKQWLEPSEFERIFLHRFNEAGLKALDTLLDNLK